MRHNKEEVMRMIYARDTESLQQTVLEVEGDKEVCQRLY